MRVLAVSLALLSLPAAAIVFGGSNLGIGGYPEPACRTPQRPPDLFKPFTRQEYQSAINEYFECLEAYIENAENDLMRIEDALEVAIAERDGFARAL